MVDNYTCTEQKGALPYQCSQSQAAGKDTLGICLCRCRDKRKRKKENKNLTLKNFYILS